MNAFSDLCPGCFAKTVSLSEGEKISCPSCGTELEIMIGESGDKYIGVSGSDTEPSDYLNDPVYMDVDESGYAAKNSNHPAWRIAKNEHEDKILSACGVRPARTAGNKRMWGDKHVANKARNFIAGLKSHPERMGWFENCLNWASRMNSRSQIPAIGSAALVSRLLNEDAMNNFIARSNYGRTRSS